MAVSSRVGYKVWLVRRIHLDWVESSSTEVKRGKPKSGLESLYSVGDKTSLVSVRESNLARL
jgi:hypothetical protein